METNECILSIDIGIHNIGYAVYDINTKEITFGLYDTDKKLTSADKKANVVVTRTKYIHMFISDMFAKYNIKKVIIERQVNNNTMAMEFMYLITSAVYSYCENIIIFDPKLKFTTLGLTYNTKNKAHKKLSIQIVKGYITKYYPHLLDTFNENSKQDDISDAILMILVHINKNDIDQLAAIKNVISS